MSNGKIYHSLVGNLIMNHKIAFWSAGLFALHFFFLLR